MPRKTRAGSGRGRGPLPGFNEAAARCRGKQPALAHVGDEARASMRPRPDAAENAFVAFP